MQEVLEEGLRVFRQYKLIGDIDEFAMVYHEPCMKPREAIQVMNVFAAFKWAVDHQCRREVDE